ESERYALPQTITPEGKLFSSAYKQGVALPALWALFAAVTVPPALVQSLRAGREQSAGCSTSLDWASPLSFISCFLTSLPCGAIERSTGSCGLNSSAKACSRPSGADGL